MSFRTDYILHAQSFEATHVDFNNGFDFTTHSPEDIRTLYSKVLQNGMHGLCFSMYEDGQKPGDHISEEQVRRRLKIMAPYTKWVRSFSCIEGNEFVPKIARELGMKTLVGAWLGDDAEKNEKEIEALITKGKTEDEAKKQAPLILAAQEMLQKWEAGNDEVIELWKTMNSWVYAGFEQTYNALGVNFDQLYYESNTYLLGKDIVEEGLEKNVFFKKPDGSVWIDLTADGLDEKLVRRADGTSVYITQDLGTAQLKYDDFNMQQSIYVVGNEQDYHFKVLFLILEKLGKTWANGLYHLSYGMVDLPSGKMKSREGTVVDADDLIEEMKQTAKEKTEALGKVDNFEPTEKEKLFEMIGMGALKYFLLKVEPKKRLLFDPNESIDFQGNTGPFIQYTHARIKSVLNKAVTKEGFINPSTLKTKGRNLSSTCCCKSGRNTPVNVSFGVKK